MVKEITNNVESEEEIEEEKKRGNSPLTLAEEKKILDQVKNEYNLCWQDTQAKRTESLIRLKLYNNQKRDKDKVGDPLLFTVFQTIFAELYDDRLGVAFEGVEEGDEDVADNLTDMAKFDHRLMEKDIIDYDWDWDACFFGRGLLFFNEFERKKKVPVVENIDPMVFIRDPRATSVNGNQKGYGAARFFGREIGLSKNELKENGSYFNIGLLKKAKDIKSLKDEASKSRKEAQGRQQSKDQEEALGENYEYQLLEWFTHYKGKKYLMTLGNDRNLLIRFQEIEDEKWPIIDRVLFPISHDWDGVSIPDLIEDKQRARSVMINLGMESAKADLYPMYLFDQRKIKNPKDLDFAFNKFIPIQGDTNNAVQPIQKSLFHQQVNLILNLLDTAAQKSVAAPEVSQGVQPRQDRTLGETELIVAGKNVRHSLAARIFGWSEKRFWRQWYYLYKQNFKEEIDKKIIRIQGPVSASWRELTKENIVAKIDPDVYVESASIAEEERKKKFEEFAAFTQIAIQDPLTNRRFILRSLGKMSGLSKVQMAVMFPATIDEMRAEDENVRVNKNDLPEVNPIDDDVVHIEIHNKATETPAKLSHIEAHKEMMLYKKEHPEEFPEEQARMESFSPVSQQAKGKEGAGKTGGAPRPQNIKEPVPAK